MNTFRFTHFPGQILYVGLLVDFEACLLHQIFFFFVFYCNQNLSVDFLCICSAFSPLLILFSCAFISSHTWNLVFLHKYMCFCPASCVSYSMSFTWIHIHFILLFFSSLLYTFRLFFVLFSFDSVVHWLLIVCAFLCLSFPLHFVLHSLHMCYYYDYCIVHGRAVLKNINHCQCVEGKQKKIQIKLIFFFVRFAVSYLKESLSFTNQRRCNQCYVKLDLYLFFPISFSIHLMHLIIIIFFIRSTYLPSINCNYIGFFASFVLCMLERVVDRWNI